MRKCLKSSSFLRVGIIYYFVKKPYFEFPNMRFSMGILICVMYKLALHDDVTYRIITILYTVETRCSGLGQQKQSWTSEFVCSLKRPFGFNLSPNWNCSWFFTGKWRNSFLRLRSLPSRSLPVHYSRSIQRSVTLELSCSELSLSLCLSLKHFSGALENCWNNYKYVTVC
jgi:hypothetical protein